MAKYDFAFKYSVVKQVLENDRSYAEAARENGLSKSDVRKWVEVYQAHGVSGLKKKRTSYTGQFKQMVVEDMRNNHLSRLETAAKYNLGNHHVVDKWERIYLENGAEGLYIERRGKTAIGRKARPPKLDKQIEEDLIAENQRLRAEVDYLKKLNALVQKKGQQKRNPR